MARVLVLYGARHDGHCSIADVFPCLQASACNGDTDSHSLLQT